MPNIPRIWLPFCVIPVRKFPPFTAGVLLVTDETKWGGGSGVSRDNFHSISEPYIGDDFPQTG
jgi:hypothetical protein